MFKKILIANRGEIAVRIIKTCKKMGIKTVAIYSEVDIRNPHSRLADEAYEVGPAPSIQSYLNMDKIISIAKETKCEAIHPGYGFLAENPVFAKKVEDSGLKFIGPSADQMKLLGDKMTARDIAIKLNIPIIKGINKPLSDYNEALEIAKDIGFPVLLKASAGGGGKGMRVVTQESEMQSSFRGATFEAQTAFGDKRIYIEKFIEKPRHIEVQILGDGAGNVVALGERECSIQRRHQKLIEETPSTVVTPEIRERLLNSARLISSYVKYRNAGTVEFLFDKDLNFYFLEVNTRLQVEHPVTEMVTGLDLVEHQLIIASEGKLALKQNDINFNGWSIEARITAEDPFKFLPTAGVIQLYNPPAGEGIRFDSGFSKASVVSPYYDSLIAKLITWGKDRNQAIERMIDALKQIVITGIDTNIPFHLFIMNEPNFRSGNINTNYINDIDWTSQKDKIKVDDSLIAIFGVTSFLLKESKYVNLKSSKEEVKFKDGIIDPF